MSGLDRIREAARRNKESKASPYLPEVGDVWNNSPRTDFYGGRLVTGVSAVMEQGNLQ